MHSPYAVYPKRTIMVFFLAAGLAAGALAAEEPISSAPVSSSAGQEPLQLEQLRLQNERLSKQAQLLSSQLKRESSWEQYLPLLQTTLPVLIAVAGFVIGFFKYRRDELQKEENRRADLKAERDRQIDNEKQRRIEHEWEQKRPFWERQLNLYFAAAEAVATIAATKDPQKRAAAENKFWTLYWGPLAIVEDAGTENLVEKAMVAFGTQLLSGAEDNNKEMKRLSLQLAHHLSESISCSWNVPISETGKLKRKALLGEDAV
jgi:hypothetical protein